MRKPSLKQSLVPVADGKLQNWPNPALKLNEIGSTLAPSRGVYHAKFAPTWAISPLSDPIV